MEKLKYKRKCTYKSCDATFYYGKRGLKLVIIQDSKTKKIVEILKDEVISIILYGSVARGTESSESDIDIALIIKNRLS